MYKFSLKTPALFLLVLLAILAFAGCGSQASGGKGASAGQAGAADPQDGQDTVKAFVFVRDDVEIPMNAEAAPILEKLGESLSYFEAESCAFQGVDRVYTYDGFQLNTYPLNDVDYVSSVVLTSDTAATGEGLEIGSAKEDMLAAYGRDYTEEYGQYTYTLGDSRLIFILEDDKVTAIEYQAILPK